MATNKSLPKGIQISKPDLWKTQKAAFLKIKTYNRDKKYGERVTTAQITTLNKILEDYISKLRHYGTSRAKLYITMGNLAELAGCSIKTAYNHILRLIKAGLLKKKTAACSFDGKTLTACIEIEICQDIVQFQEIIAKPAVHKSVEIRKYNSFSDWLKADKNRAPLTCRGHFT